MSTKIYWGYKIEQMSFHELLIFCNKLKPQFCAERNNFLHEVYGENYIKIWESLRGKQGFPLIDCSAEIIFIPTKNAIFALTFWEHGNKVYDSIWSRQPEVKYWGYWNNTDKPREISKKIWEERRKDWETCLPGVGIPTDSGFSFRLVNNNLPLPSEIIKEKS